jgi:hypothetical protein
MASITSATKARLQASDLVTVLTTRFQAENTSATSTEAYTFACGYLESMLAGIMADHPSVRKEVSERVAEIRARLVANGTFV